MKKICFFSGDITRSGGTERVSVMVANALAAQKKYQILFLSLTEQNGVPFFELRKDIGHYALGDRWLNPGPGYLKMIPRLRRFLKQYAVDLIIDIDMVLDILSIPAAKGLGVKIISWEHFKFSYEMESLYRRWILRYSVKRTDYIVTLTEGDKKAYMEKTGRRTNISAIYNPVQEMDIEETEEREKWLITVGRLVRIKGMDYLAETAVRILRQFPEWKWLVTGEGEERPFLEEFIREHHLEEQLILTGRTDDVGAYLKKAQIYVMTSRSEGFPMCLLEAKAFRLPIVSFAVMTDSGEMVEDGVNGYLIPPFDCECMAEKLRELIQNAALRRRFAEHAHDNMEKFRMERILENWNQVLENCFFQCSKS